VHCNRYKGVKDLSELVVDFVENASVLNPGFKLHDSGLRYFFAIARLVGVLRSLAEIFAVAVGDFSVMDNHSDGL